MVPAALIASVPPLTVVRPLYALLPESVSVLFPLWVSRPLPLMMPEYV